MAGNLATAALLVALGAQWGMILAVLGLTVGVSGVVVQEARSRVHRPKRVLFTSSSDSWFSEQIFHGLEDGLRGHLHYELSKLHAAPLLERKSVEAQLDCLRDPLATSADAIVIRPAAVTDRLVAELVRLSAAGVMLVFVNTQPPLRSWREVGLLPPRFVGCDMAEGGRLVGAAVCEVARSIDADGIILLDGPSTKQSNLVRTAWATRAILTCLSEIPCVVEPIEDFDSSHAVRGFKAAIGHLDEQARSPARRLVLHPGTDRAAAAIARWMARNESRIAGQVREVAIVGFDGLRGPDGSLLVDDVPGVVATVDQQPYLLGIEAAAHIIAAAEGRARTWHRETTVTPRVLQVQRSS